jgi:hypothetical protein
MGMLRAHIDLAKAEFSEIADRLKQVAILGSLALGCGFTLLLLAPLGILLFLGEWLFGSIGWGVLLGSELMLAFTVVFLVAAVGVSARTILVGLVVSAIVGIVVGVILGLNLTNQGWVRLGDSIAGNIVPEWRVIVVAVGSSAIVLGILLALLGLLRAGLGGLVGGLIGGVILGAAIGGLTAISYSVEVAAAMGVSVALAVWPVLVVLPLVRQGIDMEELKARFWPQQTIDTTKETIEWVREQTPLGRKP